MTVRELIARLEQFDSDLLVVRAGEDFMYFVRDVALLADADAQENPAHAAVGHSPADSVVVIS